MLNTSHDLARLRFNVPRIPNLLEFFGFNYCNLNKKAESARFGWLFSQAVSGSVASFDAFFFDLESHVAISVHPELIVISIPRRGVNT